VTTQTGMKKENEKRTRIDWRRRGVGRIKLLTK